MMAVTVSGYVDAEGGSWRVGVSLTTIGGPCGEITYLPGLIRMPDVRPGYRRGTQPLGSARLAWGR